MQFLSSQDQNIMGKTRGKKLSQDCYVTEHHLPTVHKDSKKCARFLKLYYFKQQTLFCLTM